MLDRRRLDQRQSLEQLIERPEPARADHERAGVPDEHHLAGEEVPEAQPDVEVVVEPLLAGKLDVASHRQRARVARAAIGRLHQAAATAGDHREAGPPELDGPPGARVA